MTQDSEWRDIASAPIGKFDPARWWVSTFKALVANKDGWVFIASYGFTQGGKGRWTGADHRVATGITHWQPLPEPPEASKP